jgi:ketosteroid isomerase-like protein
VSHRKTMLGALLCVGLAARVESQEKLSERTLKLSPGAASPAATLADMAWLAGHWAGPALGGESEEIWSDPRAGAMMGMYRLVKDGKIVFYELLTVVEEKGSLLLRLKHFNPDLTGWEEKQKTVDFPLVALSKGAIHFEGMSFHPQGDDTMTVYLALRGKDGDVREATFTYTRVKAGATPPPREATRADFDKVMSALAEAWSKRDTSAALACFTADAVYMQPPDLQLYRGTAELEKLFRGIRPGTVMQFHALAFDAGRQSGFGEFSFGRQGAAKADHGVVVVQLRDGRIASWREYFQEGPGSFADFIRIDGKTWKWTGRELQ